MKTLDILLLAHRVRVLFLRVEHGLTLACAHLQENLSAWAEDRRYALASIHYTERTESVKDREFYYDRLSQSFLQASRDNHRRCERLERRLDVLVSSVVDGVRTSTFEEDLRRYYDEAPEPTCFGS